MRLSRLCSGGAQRDWRKRLRPLAPVFKAGLLIVATLVVIGAALMAAIPYILANDRIKDGIRAELSRMTGLPVAVTGDISVSVFPVFVARLGNIEFGSGAAGPSFSMTAASLSAELSWLAALGQRVQMRSISVDGADIKLNGAARGEWLPSAMASPFAPLILQARQAMAANPANPDFSFLPEWRIGSVTFTNAKLRVTEPGGDQNLISALDLRATWPSVADPLQITSAGVWRGGEFRSSATIGNPVQMAAGGSGGLSAGFTADAASFNFDGVANLNRVFFANGDVKFETRSIGELLNWIGAEMDAGATIGQMALEAALVTKDDKMNFDNAVINFNGNPAKGVFELSRTEDMPALSGTIAFEQLDLASFLSAFSIGTNPATTQSGVRFFDQLDLDLRLSASSANAGPLPLTEVGAAVRIKNGKADFDLGDAALYGGRAQANLTLSEAAGLPDGNLSIKLTGINLSQIPGTGDLPNTSAPADGSLELQGKYSGLLPFLKEADGAASVQLASGEIRNLDASAFAQRLDGGQIFNLPEVYEGLAGINGANAKAAIKDGVAILSGTTLDLNSAKLTLSGAVPFFSRGIALGGELTDTATAIPRRFFVGGSWEQPFVTPIK
jgi:AsmA protein